MPAMDLETLLTNNLITEKKSVLSVNFGIKAGLLVLVNAKNAGAVLPN